MTSTIQVKGHTIHPHFLTSNSFVLDLGANHGAFANEIAKRFHCQCLAVEGNAVLASTLLAAAGVRVQHAVVGDRNQAVEFSITENDQCSSVLPPLTSRVIRRETVSMVSLRELLSASPTGHVDLVKMDIEGAEILVLDGCADADLQRIAQLTIEFHDALGLTSLPDIARIAARLQTLGFCWIRGTFSNFEDNLFLNRRLCPLSSWEILCCQTIFRWRHGFLRRLGRWRGQRGLPEMVNR